MQKIGSHSLNALFTNHPQVISILFRTNMHSFDVNLANYSMHYSALSAWHYRLLLSVGGKCIFIKKDMFMHAV